MPFKNLPNLQICQSQTVGHCATIRGSPLIREDACSQIKPVYPINARKARKMETIQLCTVS